MLSLLLVDELHQNALVLWKMGESASYAKSTLEANLEDVTFALEVELVVQMVVNLLLLAVLAEQTTEDTGATDPDDLDGHTRVGGTLSLT